MELIQKWCFQSNASQGKSPKPDGLSCHRWSPQNRSLWTICGKICCCGWSPGPSMAAIDGPWTICGAVSGPPQPQMVPLKLSFEMMPHIAFGSLHGLCNYNVHRFMQQLNVLLPIYIVTSVQELYSYNIASQILRAFIFLSARGSRSCGTTSQLAIVHNSQLIIAITRIIKLISYSQNASARFLRNLETRGQCGRGYPQINYRGRRPR